MSVPVLPPGDRPLPAFPERSRKVRSGAAAGAPVGDAATPYERLPRTLARWSWWRMLLALVAAGGLFVALQTLVFGVGLMLSVLRGDVQLTDAGLFDWLNRLVTLDAARPLDLAITLLSLGVIIPSVYLGLRIVGFVPTGHVASVAYRLRWGWLRRCALVAGATIVVSLGGSLLLSLAFGEELTPAWTPWPTLVASVLVVVLLVPFQAAAEEYAFRGLLVQALGSWLPRRWWSRVLVVAIPTALFVAGHVYDPWGLADVGTFALAAMWLTLRTGGLEAAIALHVANNVGIFLMLASGVLGSTAQSDEGGSLTGVLITAITSFLYCWVVEVLANRTGLQRRSPWPEHGATPPLPVPVPPPYAAAPAPVGAAGYPTRDR